MELFSRRLDPLNQGGSWFRVFLAGWTMALVTFAGWLAGHASSTPQILGRYSTGYFVVIAAVAVMAGVSLLAQAPFLYGSLWRKRREMLLLMGSALVTVGAIEAALRIVDPFGLSYFREMSRYQLDMLPDRVLVFKHAPNLQTTYQGVPVSTNEMGLRERRLEKNSGELRILLLGDSVTFGWGVPVEATFGRRLEALLAVRSRRPVRTINSGVAGYNTVQQATFLEAYHHTIDPNTAVLLYVSNDIEPNDPPFDPWSARSLSGKSPGKTIQLLLRRSWLFRLGAFSLSYARPRKSASLDKGSRGFKESMSALSAMTRFCRARGIPFVTFFYRKEPSAHSDALLTEVRAVGDREQFPVIDVVSWWGGHDRRSLTSSIVDGHPNARGHEILAKGIADALAAHGVLGEPRSP